MKREQSAKVILLFVVALFSGCATPSREFSLREMDERADPKNIPYFIQMLGDAKPNVRENAAGALSKLGHQAKEAIPSLVQALKDEQWVVRRHAAMALGRIGPTASDIAPVFDQALHGETVTLRANAVYFLGEIPNVEGVSSVLIQAITDRDRRIRMEAAIALRKLSLKAEEVVSALTRVKNEDIDKSVQLLCAEALNRIKSREEAK